VNVSEYQVDREAGDHNYVACAGGKLLELVIRQASISDKFHS